MLIQSIRQYTIQFMSSIRTAAPVVQLGRWEHRLNEEQKEVKSVWNNSDHCGDIICGNPKMVKQILEDENSTKSRV